LNFLPNISRFAIYALLVFTPLAAGAVQGWAITLIHLVTLLALTTLLLQKAWNWDWKWISTPLDKPFVALLILIILATIFSMHRRTSFWSLILLVNYLTLYYLVVHTVQTRSQVRHLIYVIIGVAVFLSVFGLAKFSGFNPFPWWNYVYFQPSHIHRLTATYVNANHIAGYLEMSGLLLVGFLFTGMGRRGKILMTCCILGMLLSFILSLSRGGWIGGFMGMTLTVFVLLSGRRFEKKKVTVALAGGLCALLIVILTYTPVAQRIRTLEQKETRTNFAARVTAWKGAVDMIENHYPVGTGPGTFPVVFPQYQPAGLMARYFMAHNDYLQFISEAGVALVPLLVWMMIVFFKKGFRKLSHPSRLVRGTTLGAMAGLTAILFHSIFDFNLHIPANALVFTVLAAVAMSPIPKPDK